MKLNDPFGRLERRNQANYEMMREAMKRGGIQTEEAALNVIETSKRRLLRFLAILAAVFLVIVFMFPQSWPIMLTLAGMVAIWAIKSIKNGRRYVERYIKEEL